MSSTVSWKTLVDLVLSHTRTPIFLTSTVDLARNPLELPGKACLFGGRPCSTFFGGVSLLWSPAGAMAESESGVRSGVSKASNGDGSLTGGATFTAVETGGRFRSFEDFGGRGGAFLRSFEASGPDETAVLSPLLLDCRL